MNAIHRIVCGSDWWARGVERELVPWCVEGVELGDEVLEVGPGLGATTRVLRPGGVFAGTDSLGEGWLFRAIHVGKLASVSVRSIRVFPC